MKKFLLFLSLLVCVIVAKAQVNENDKNIALQLVQKNSAGIGLLQNDLDNSIITGTYIVPGTEIRMVYLQQSLKSIPVYNQLHVLAFKNDQLVSVTGSRIAAIEQKINNDRSTPLITAVDAVQTAATESKVKIQEMIIPVTITRAGQKMEFGKLGVSTENIYAELLWFPVRESNEVKLVWQVFMSPQNSSDYWLIRVDAITNTVISKENLTISCNWGDENHSPKDHLTEKEKTNQNSVAIDNETKLKKANRPFVVDNATYRVIRYPAESPIHPGGGHTFHNNPWTMSPGNATSLGWHNDGSVFYDSTRGNNAFAYDDRDANNLPGRSGLSSTSQPDLTFDFVPDYTLEPVVRTPAPNQQFNTTNLFYWNNLMHDLSYIYGFTETARNYQNNNQGRGGNGGDYVLAEAQDGSGTNNANFSSGTDGTRGRMQMYLWTSPNPDRDGDVDNGIIAHEYTHGISNRMTGTGSGCLSNVEQMGEGWSDYLGLMITHNWATAIPSDGFNNPRGIGTYALNQPITGVGIRQYRYTTNMAVNPMTYANLPTVVAPHGVGTIWCTALWDMTWYIIQQAGINPNLFNPAGVGGNSIALKLVIEGLRLQPCSPGFIDGRNAILKADTLFFGAQYSCAIMEAFARRGMGVGASQGSSSVRGDEIITFVDGRPVITAQPQSVSLCTGNNNTFSVTATGLGLTYQWQISTDGGTIYNNIGGATSSSYTVTGVTVGMNNYRYKCIVTGCPPSVTTNAAILTVSNGPTVTSQPNNSVVCEANNTSFTVGGSSGVTYQWQLSTDGGANYNNIPGATSATINLTAVTASMNNYRYRCVLTSAGCAVPAVSNAAILTVNSIPAITAQPSNTTLCVGANNTFSVTATGTGILYQWQLSTDGGVNYNNITGATVSSYTVSGATVGMNGNRYRCVVSGTCPPSVNSLSTSGILTVIAPVSIAGSGQPVNSDLCSGSNASFSVSGTSTEAIVYQWQVSTDGGANWNSVTNGGVYTGATTATLNITGATTSISTYRYRCLLSNATCSIPTVSGTGILTVRQLPTVGLSASPLTALLPGQTTTLTATPSASTGGILSIAWWFNGALSSPAITGNTYVANVEKIGSYQVKIQEAWPGNLVCSNQSTTIVIDAVISNKLFIFPSPNDGNFTVSYYNASGTSTQRRITIFDSKGALAYDRQFNITGPYTLIPINLQSSSRGIYYVVVGDANGRKLADGKVHVR
ncbi:MAG: M36 family metallopeptidase [Chitinophagaceae bacterium]|nr:M36 family metallopeptidase [Chitinophagaceae bacterium]